MRSILLISMIFICGLGYGQTSEDLKRLEEFKRRVNAPVVFTVLEKPKVKVTNDLPYTTSSEPYRKLDIYQPDNRNDKKKLPVVIFIHGKTPIETDPKNWGSYKSWAELATAKGFISVTFTHSLAIPGKSIEDAGTDLLAVLDYVKSKHSLYNIDTTRIALLAYSAGVPLLSEALIHRLQNVKCLVGFYGFMDMTNIDMWKSESQSTLSKFSLINYISSDKKFPPLFIARAGKEHNKGLNETMDPFMVKANNANLNLTFMNHATGVHGFDTQNDDDRSREIIESVFTFLQYHLR